MLNEQVTHEPHCTRVTFTYEKEHKHFTVHAGDTLIECSGDTVIYCTGDTVIYCTCDTVTYCTGNTVFKFLGDKEPF